MGKRRAILCSISCNLSIERVFGAMAYNTLTQSMTVGYVCSVQKEITY
jgi:hypothetical protein